MASPLMDAMQANIIASMDPTQRVMSALLQQQVKSQDVTLDDTRLEMIGKIQTLLEKPDLNQSVKAAYEKMLAKYTA